MIENSKYDVTNNSEDNVRIMSDWTEREKVRQRQMVVVEFFYNFS